MSAFAKTANRRAGFTLLELVIVLGILSLLTMLASRGIANRQRELRSVRANAMLEELEKAIAGDRFAGDGISVSFVGDMGRLPRAATNCANEAELTLGELFVRPADAAPFGVYLAKANLCKECGLSSLPMDSNVIVQMGWRGPYMRLGPGETDPFLRDAWGNPMTASNALVTASNGEDRLLAEDWDGGAGSVATNGMPIAFIRHLGANGLSRILEPGETGPDADVSIAPVSNAFATAVCGYVETRAAASEIVVRLYGPPPRPASEAESRRVMAWQWRRTGAWAAGSAVPFALANLSERMTSGPRIIRACTVSSGAVTNYSRPTQIFLLPGVNALRGALDADGVAP